MKIENIQYVYDHTGLYRTELSPLNNQFFKRLQKTTNRDNKKIQLKLARKRCRSRTAIFGPKKYIQLSLPQMPRKCYRPSHKCEEVKSRPKRRKRKDFEKIFSKTIIFKVLKATSYKIKKTKRFVYSYKGSAWDM